MKHFTNFRSGVLLATSFGAGLLLCGAFEFLFGPQARTQAKPVSKPNGVVDVPLDRQTPNDRLPDQFHEMQDAGYIDAHK